MEDGALTGLITQDATWSGTVLIGIDRSATTRIEPGVTITVAPGTVIKFKAGVGAGLDIRGSLKVQGTKAEKVTFEAADGMSSYRLNLGADPTPGTLELNYAVLTRGIIQTQAGSTATITDTKMYKAAGDLLIMSGGTVNMTYSQIGPDPGEDDTTHCQIHTGGAAVINITRSNINSGPVGGPRVNDTYGMMFYGGQNAILTNNNWFTNVTQIATQPGVSGDLTGSWFDLNPPMGGGGATLNGLDALSGTQILDAGVR